jgi:hypothetical protein
VVILAFEAHQKLSVAVKSGKYELISYDVKTGSAKSLGTQICTKNKSNISLKLTNSGLYLLKKQ